MAHAEGLVDGLATLTVNPLGLGDVLFCTPALHLLRESLPGSRIGFMAQPGFLDALRNSPDVDELHALATGQGRLVRYWRGRRLSRALAAFGYQQALLFGGHKDVEDWVANAGIPRSRIFVVPKVRGDVTLHTTVEHWTYAARLLGRLEAEQAQHVKRTDAAVGLPRVYPREPDRAAAAALLPPALRDGAPFVVAHIGNSTFRRPRFELGGSRISHRAWPLENWRLCLPRLVERLGVDLVLTGSPKEGEIAQALLAEAPAALRARIHDVSGRTPPLTLAALLERAAVYVGADTGPTHFAAAVGTPTVVLYGPTDERQTLPGHPQPERLVVLRHPVPCSPCSKAVRKRCRDNVCLRGIAAEEVVDTVGRLLHASQEAPPTRPFGR
jgi:ADP-heptose:LPS heptosyltransferase